MMFDSRKLPPWSMLAAARVPSELAPANQALFEGVHAYSCDDGPLPGISGITYDGKRHLIPLFDPRSIPPEELVERLSGYDCLYPVPAELLDGLDWRIFKRTVNEDDSDYLFHATGIRSLCGPGRSGRRSLAARFEQVFRPDAVSIVGQEEDARQILVGWLADVSKEADQTDRLQAESALAQMTQLGLTGRLVRTVQGEPAGFLLASIHKTCAIIHFAKGRRKFDGVYPWMFQDFALAYPELTWLNFEQDLGNSGLRRNKRAFVPDDFVRKFRVSPQ